MRKLSHSSEKETTRMDNVSSQKRSEIMSKVRGKESKIEANFRKNLWSQKVRYRKNKANLFGKPDISIQNLKVVIFIDSCFWHGCEQHLRIPASNKDYWRAKIDRNVQRDKIVSDYYNAKKWHIIRIWEHELKNDKTIARILSEIQKLKNKPSVLL